MLKTWRKIYWRVFFKLYIKSFIRRMRPIIVLPLILAVELYGEEDFIIRGASKYKQYIIELGNEIPNAIDKMLKSEQEIEKTKEIIAKLN